MSGIEMNNDDPDVWDRLNISYGGYNSVVDQQIFDVAKMIVAARKVDDAVFRDEIAKTLGMSAEHVELIQYILASVTYPDRPHLNNQAFTYGTSPRGLFVDDMECAEMLLAEFETFMEQTP